MLQRISICGQDKCWREEDVGGDKAIDNLVLGSYSASAVFPCELESASNLSSASHDLDQKAVLGPAVLHRGRPLNDLVV